MGRIPRQSRAGFLGEASSAFSIESLGSLKEGNAKTGDFGGSGSLGTVGKV